jgi:hypothetical protein
MLFAVRILRWAGYVSGAIFLGRLAQQWSHAAIDRFYARWGVLGVLALITSKADQLACYSLVSFALSSSGVTVFLRSNCT